MACWPKRSDCGPIFRAPMFRELLMQATAVVQRAPARVAPRPIRRPKSSSVLAKVSKEVGARVGPRDYRAAQRIVLGLDRAGRSTKRRSPTFCGEQQIRGDGRGAGDAGQSADQCRRSADGRRPARSGADPVQGRRLGWPTVKAIIMRASGRQEPSQPGARRGFRQFRPAFGIDGAARGAVLAGRGRTSIARR